MRNHIHKITSWIAVLIWMAFIFFLSHQPAGTSSELSSGVLNIAVRMIDVVLPFITYEAETLHFFIRKGAHFFAYFMLGLLVLHALFVSDFAGLRARHLSIHGAGIALIISVLYAISDEVHQLFIPGRSGEVRDVLIDSVGALVGIGFYMFVLLSIRRIRVFLANKFSGKISKQ